MSPWRRTGNRGLAVLRVEAPVGVVQIHLEEMGRHSWTQALLGAVIGSEDGPPFRFVAAPPDPAYDASEQVAARAGFPVVLARQRLDELDAELVALGWRRRPDRGPYWWSLRYDPPAARRS
jgi:hypothetical protein